MSLCRWISQASGALVVLASAYCAQKAVDEALQQCPELSDDNRQAARLGAAFTCAVIIGSVVDKSIQALFKP
ncbi:hypothetical protein H7E95_10575 [Proteus mirabilis]|uniref:hypothetical protein n=1 Tax=Proteus mirabilis TaxID=584 RepID=UPI001629B4BB|nr:hypothetical protein [Proteus mirabilis]MBB6688341.1 hypothetical protein [Proteus mirabilis]MBI6417171.1 hypothetical protein [Proteus mirabilis]HEK1023598.1 hypothetical protein [Proteus mirabilis]HEK1945268.1 hypothetical protein [Proteus mirabilis]HEK2746524.1 hypothetical protein [Proteus mirabilis]